MTLGTDSGARVDAPERGVSGADGARELTEIAVEAYVFLYPLVNMDVFRRQATNIESGQRPAFGPMNMFNHMRAYPPGDMKVVARPNFDTLYSSVWLDLTAGPVVVSAPDTHGRLFLLQMMDMWTDAFGVPGSGSRGTAAGHFGAVPPGWQGELPPGVERVDAPTPYVWIFGRTQTNGPADYEAVNQVQDGYVVTPLSQWGRDPESVEVTIDPTVDMTTPVKAQVDAMPAATYFRYAAELMALHRPHLSDWSVVARMRRLGIEAGRHVQFDALDQAVREALEQAPAAGQQAMRDKLPTLGRRVNGWQMVTDTVGVYGNYYMKRALLTILGMGALPPEESIYPIAFSDADGAPLDGGHDYVLHFDRPELPPADAFWSITMYDQDGFQVANPLDRFALGDRDPLRYNADGSLDMHVQHESPGAGDEANWLPSAAGPFGLTMRLYHPRPEALDGRWSPPPVRRVA
jgi:hypothetical protein